MPSIEVVLEDVPSSRSEDKVEDAEGETQGEEVVDSIAATPSQENGKEVGDDSLKPKEQTSLKHKVQAESKPVKKLKPSSCLSDLEKELMKQAELVEQAIGLHLDQTAPSPTNHSKQLAELEHELLLRRKLVEQALSAVSSARRNPPEIVFNFSSDRSHDCQFFDEKKDDAGMRKASESIDVPPKREELPASKFSFDKVSHADIGMESPVKSLVEKELHQEMSPAVISIESTSPSSPTGTVVNQKKRSDTMNYASAVVSPGCTATEEELDLPLSLDEAFDRVGSFSENSKPQEAGVEHPQSVAISYTAGVYIKDDVFGWLPATVLEAHDEFAFVSVDMASNWSESTAVHGDGTEDQTSGMHKTMRLEKDIMDRIVNEHMVPQHSIRRVMWKDYKDGILPSQNDQVTKPDMGDLEHLHEAAILFNLKERHFMSKPYTRVGDIMVAMNPFNWINDMYTPQTQEKYTREIIWQDEIQQSRSIEEYKNYYSKLGLEPHVYEVSSVAYRGLATEGRDQTILVAGESGAGKTETVKIVMSHLATIPKTRFESQESDIAHTVSDDIVTKICQSSPIFEAFGNAKTMRNDNSSRFGKFTQLQFAMEGSEKANQNGRVIPQTDLVGSICTTYLLEKSRVVSHSPGERTYHIFYQLLAAPQEFKRLLWPHFGDCKVDDFNYMGDPVEASSVAHSDAQLWEETAKSLSLFQFEGDTLLDLMRVLGIVLQLGNLSFDRDTSSGYEGHSSMITSKTELERLSAMIGIDSTELEDTMTCRTIKARSEVLKVKVSHQVAKEWCDALAKEIYSRTFELMVWKINDHTAVNENAEKRKIGHVSLLDIFGFESLKVNGFEQLCINYANETLQQKYVLDNFNRVKEEYEREEIDLYDFALVDNSNILDLLEGPMGLIGFLNEECHLPPGKKDEMFVFKAKRAHKGTKCIIDEKLHQKTEFGIRHFAGPVIYDANKFVERNMDKLPEGLVECAKKSTNALIRTQFEASLVLSSQSSLSKRGSVRRDRFVLEKFQTQLRNLMGVFEESRTFYIRCIKPNNFRAPRKTDQDCVNRQLKCSGILTAIAMTRECFPTKLDYESILGRYGCLMQERGMQSIGTMHHTVEYALSNLLRSASRKNRDGSTTMPFSCGKSNIYFRAGVQERLEILRTEYLSKKAAVIQSWLKTDKFMERVSRSRRSATKIQKLWRRALEISRYKNKKLSATKIQTQHRARGPREHFHAARDAVIVIQKATRNAHRRQVAAARLNAWARKVLALRQATTLRRERDSANVIQRNGKRFLNKRARAATEIQTVYRRLSAKKLAETKTAEVERNRNASKDEPENWLQSMIDQVYNACVCGVCPMGTADPAKVTGAEVTSVGEGSASE